MAGSPFDGLQAGADFDGDGVTDVSSATTSPRRRSALCPRRNFSAAMRSGQARRPSCGRSRSTPTRERWVFWQTAACSFSVLSPPGGDLDGDGAADIVVRKGENRIPGYGSKLSPHSSIAGGSPAVADEPSGRRAFGRLQTQHPWADLKIKESMPASASRGLARCLVRYDLGFDRSSRNPPVDRPPIPDGAALGRDKRVLWDVLLAEQDLGNKLMGFTHELASPMAAEIVLLLRKSKADFSAAVRTVARRVAHERRVAAGINSSIPADGDGRPEVMVNNRVRKSRRPQVARGDGRAGKLLWSWRGSNARGTGLIRIYGLPGQL